MPVTIGGSGPITGVTSINTTVSDTELGYLDGVSSALQTQINAKANDSSQGLYLITPSSIANSGGSASASGGAVTFTTVNSVSLNGIFSATYGNYFIAVSITAASGTGAGVQFRLRASGTDTSTSTYNLAYGRGGRTSLADGGSTLAQAQWTPFYTTTGYTAQCNLTIYRANSSGSAGMVSHAFSYDSGYVSEYAGGNCTQATAHDGLTLLVSTGTISGVIRAYGYKD